MCPLLTANSLSGRGFPRKGHLLRVMKSSLLKVKQFSDQTPYPEVTLQTTTEAVGRLAAPNNTRKFSLLCLQQGGPAYPRSSAESWRVSEGLGCLGFENYLLSFFLLCEIECVSWKMKEGERVVIISALHGYSDLCCCWPGNGICYFLLLKKSNFCLSW